ncbi:hypothetical protein AV521_00470 [Streptomyces sp. IMTB 2501]|uniref:CHAT domain-containing protein n=1 Tax=Streptomyces sp. IMTB 2501 TaxID=1776340 RepID=UPI00096F56A3|nr:CHAT domain-containing protein [Streptomyces sp. IMTB 2501]OLZ74207.1 hypothetical protein AV521_00470 [Streptomyces sp. IMTB 2501]
MLARLRLLARADGAERRSEVLRDERTGAARAALLEECGSGRWSNILKVHQLGLLAWLLGVEMGDSAELGVAADWLFIVHRCDPALLPAPLRSARPEQFTADGLAALLDATGGREHALTAAQEFIAGGLGWAATPQEAEAISVYVRGRDLSQRDGTEHEADEAARQALAALPVRHWLRPFALELAASARALLALAQGLLGSEEAERLARQAIEAVPRQHPLLPRLLAALQSYRVLALGLLLMNSESGRLDVLPQDACREAVELGREALGLLAEDDPRVDNALPIHAQAVFLLLCGDPHDRPLRAELLRHGKIAAERCAGSPDKEAARWLELGNSLKALFLLTTDPELLRELIDALGTANRLAPQGSLAAAKAARALGWAEFRRAAGLGDLPGLNAAADHFIRVTTDLGLPVAEDTPQEAAERALARVEAQNELQGVLVTRSELTGDLGSRWEVLSAQPEPLPDIRTGSGDFHEVISLRELASARLDQAQKLFTAQWLQATRDNRPKTLLRAAEQLRAAADEFAAAVPEFRHLADGTHRTAAAAARQADAMESGTAGTAEEMTAELLTEGSPDLLLDDTLFGREDDADQDVTAAPASPEGPRPSLDGALALRHLKGHEVVRLRLTVARQEAERAVGERQRGVSYADAWSRALAFCAKAYADPAASPVELLPHARFMAEAAARLDDLPAVAPLLAAAVRMSGALASPRFPRAEREALLAEYAGGLGDLACAAALSAGEPAEEALAVLEAARGLLYANALNSMTELGTLRRDRPEEAARFESATAALVAAQEIPASSGLEAVTLRHRATDRWEAEVGRIQGLAGFEDFLQPLTPARARALADRGPLVHVTLHALRSHALLVTADGVTAEPLPGVSPSLAQEWTARLERAGADTDAAAGEVRAVLGELWDAVASPVLGALGFTGPPESPADRPRVWWVPSGPAVFLPLHAAGRFGGTADTRHQVPAGTEDAGGPAHPAAAPRQLPGANVLDRVVSSYMPTLRALRHARLRPDPKGRPSVLAIAAPGAADSPGRLRWAVDEALDVRDAVGAGRYLPPEEATLPTVGQALSEHPWLHYAGHGAHGALALGDELLTPSAVDRLSLPSAELVYLSGCDTAKGAASLADESLHLASALHLAGYRDAVGTLWRVRDDTAAQITEDFYRELRGAAGHHPAAALDAAVRAARRRAPDRPDLWAAHLHIGP